MSADAIRSAHSNSRAACILCHVGHRVPIHDLDIRKLLHPFQNQVRRLELLALHDERVLGVVPQGGVVEFRYLAVGRPVPELEDRRDEPDARHIVGKAVVAEQIKRGRMRGRRSGIGLRAVIVVEQAHRYPLATQ